MTGRTALVRELHQPVAADAAFEMLRGRPGCFFLDSSMDEKRLGRYSFVGSDPFLTVKSRGRSITEARPGDERCYQGDPFESLRSLLTRYRLDRGFSPVPCNGGVVGYFSYDLCHFIERLPRTAADDLQLPESSLGFYDVVLVFDNLLHRTYVVSTGFPENEESKRLRRASQRLDDIEDLIRGNIRTPGPDRSFSAATEALTLHSNFTPDDYLRAVQRAREYIIAGDIFQVNLSQRFDAQLAVSPFDLYQRLRATSPAPFSSYLDAGDVVVAGSSPERFLRLRGDIVETRPIKGTRPRGEDPLSDQAMARELVGSVKDRAENLMIVDLERNDLGRVCTYGSVEVTELAALETFPTVFHLTSTVVGKLRPGKDRIDLLRATFPGGSITGAPKVRSMEIIDELEPTCRSVYTGSVGYLSFSGEMDLNIVIRTFLAKQERVYFQVGGGIVYDSSPEAEYQETLDKAKGLVAALKLAPKAAVRVI